jgi:hypothetical protein
MADKNSSKEQPQASEEGNSVIFKVLIVVIGLGVLVVILKGAGVF